MATRYQVDFVLFGCGPNGVLFGLQKMPGLTGSRPSLFSWPYDCDRPPGPFGPMGGTVEAVGSSFSPENEHQDLPWF